MGQMTVEQWYGTIKTGLTKKLTENKEALPAGFNQQRFILNCITVIQDMMKDDKKKAQLEKINPETIPVCLAKAAYLGLDFFNGECYAIPYGGTRKIIEMDKDGNTKPAKIETVETEEDIIPDVGACCFWLKNRRPDIWRDKQEIGLYEIEDMEGIEADIYGGEE